MTLPWWSWMILAGVLGLAEMNLPGAYLMWMALGAAVTGAADAAFGLSLEAQLEARALIKHLDAVSEADIVGLNVPTGVPLVYELDAALRPLRHDYLGDPDEIARRVAAVSAQGKARV